jgi:hypothetical protein
MAMVETAGGVLNHPMPGIYPIASAVALGTGYWLRRSNALCYMVLIYAPAPLLYWTGCSDVVCISHVLDVACAIRTC